MLDFIELPAGEKAFLSLQLPPGLIIIFDAVTHATAFRSRTIRIGGFCRVCGLLDPRSMIL